MADGASEPLTTESGFQIVGPVLDLPGPGGRFEQPYLAVVGVHGRSFTQDLFLHAERLLRATAASSQAFGVRLFAYLAQAGVLYDDRRPVRHRQMRWPPVVNGALEMRRNHWKRPWFSPTGLEVRKDHLRDALAVYAEAADLGLPFWDAISALPPTRDLDSWSSMDFWLSDAAYWPSRELDYHEPMEEARSRVTTEASVAARAWLTAPSQQNSAEAFQAVIDRLAAAGDLAGLAAALELVREGHRISHAVIRHQQQRALEEAYEIPGVAELRSTFDGIHRLFYEAHDAFGLESWQWAGSALEGTFRLVLPELVGLVRDLRGRRWLDALMSAYARKDEVSVTARLTEYRQTLLELGAYHSGAEDDVLFQPDTETIGKLKVADPTARADAGVEEEDDEPADYSDPTDRWRELLSDAGPTQRRLLQAWLEAQRAEPHRDIPLAEIARRIRLRPTPEASEAAADQAIRRLRRRSS